MSLSLLLEGTLKAPHLSRYVSGEESGAVAVDHLAEPLFPPSLNPLEKAKMKSPNFSPSSESSPSSSSAQIVAALLQLPAASPPSAALKLWQSRRREPECLSLSIPVHNRARLLANRARPSLFPRGSPPRIAPARLAVAASEIGDASAFPCSTSHILTHVHQTKARVVPSPPITNRRPSSTPPLLLPIRQPFAVVSDCLIDKGWSQLSELKCKGREDDNIETIRKRFKVYMESSLPVIEYYSAKGKVKKIDAAKPIGEVFEAVKAIFTPPKAVLKFMA